jgi:hypothetical protein
VRRWRQDADWWATEEIVVLGEEFGSAGPLTIHWLSCEAAWQGSDGRVTAGPHGVARGIFIGDATMVERIIERAVELGLLADVEHGDADFTARLTTYRAANGRQAISRISRLAVFTRDGFTCQRCGWRAPAGEGFDGSHAPRDEHRTLQVDHRIPVAHGGGNELENLQAMCAPCNQSKGARL